MMRRWLCAVVLSLASFGASAVQIMLCTTNPGNGQICPAAIWVETEALQTQGSGFYVIGAVQPITSWSQIQYAPVGTVSGDIYTIFCAVASCSYSAGTATGGSWGMVTIPATGGGETGTPTRAEFDAMTQQVEALENALLAAADNWQFDGEVFDLALYAGFMVWLVGLGSGLIVSMVRKFRNP